MSPKTYHFHSRLKYLGQMPIANTYKGPPAKQKKQARIAFSVSQASENIGFLHACLLNIKGDYFLLAGKSGIGKTTLANGLCQKPDKDICANDWVAIEKDGKNFYGSDLNFATSLKHVKRCLIKGIIFLQKTDAHQRDAYTPNETELKQLLRQDVFDGTTSAQAEKLSQFWVDNSAAFSVMGCVPVGKVTVDQSLDIISDIVGRAKLLTPPVKLNVGIIGIGSIGSLLAYRLGKHPSVGKICLYDHKVEKAHGIALDLNHSSAITDPAKYAAGQRIKDVFSKSNVVFVCFRDSTPPPNVRAAERMNKLLSHLETVRLLAQTAAELRFRGTIFIITNPVDLLSYSFYAAGQSKQFGLKTYQVYGVGLELDIARVLFYSNRFHYGLSPDNITLYGEHTEKLSIDIRPELLSTADRE